MKRPRQQAQRAGRARLGQHPIDQQATALHLLPRGLITVGTEVAMVAVIAAAVSRRLGVPVPLRPLAPALGAAAGGGLVAASLSHGRDLLLPLLAGGVSYVLLAAALGAIRRFDVTALLSRRAAVDV